MNDGDQSWLLVSTALVQLMTPGLAFFYSGLGHHKSTVHVMMLSFGCLSVISLAWGLVGYSLAFGPSTSTGVVGDLSLGLIPFSDQVRMLPGLPEGGNSTTVSEHIFMLFQLMFAIITAAIISGAVVQKMKYIWFMVFVLVWHIFVYCPLAHYLFYSDGWLFQYGALDFAGGMVVHTSSGISALVLTFWLGKHVEIAPATPHNVPNVMLGASLLWFGWFGFNAGSALSAGFVAGRAMVTTHFAAAAGMATWNLLEIAVTGTKWFNGRITAVGAACGVVAGLVGITPSAGFVTPMASIAIGAITAVGIFWVPKLVKIIKIDDRLDAFAFHGVGGIIGSLLTGLFATKEVNSGGVDGAFYGTGELLGKQIVAILVTTVFSVVGTTVIYWTLWCVSKLVRDDMRLPDDPMYEVDTHQHGQQAYEWAGLPPSPNFKPSRSMETLCMRPLELDGKEMPKSESNLSFPDSLSLNVTNE